MDILLLRDVLDELVTIGVDEVVLEPIEGEEGTRFRGANKAQNIIIFDTLEETLVTIPMGIQSVKALHSRMQLFDLSKASVTLDDNDKHIKGITFKQGKKKATYRTANPKLLGVPARIPDADIVGDGIVFTKDYVSYLLNAAQSLSLTGNRDERKLSISVEENEMTLSINDGEDDSFTDVIDVGTTNTQNINIPKCSWELDPFKRVLKQSSECTVDETARFSITEFGIAIFDMQPLSVIVAPMTS